MLTLGSSSETSQTLLDACPRRRKHPTCWQVGNCIEKGEVVPPDIFFYRTSNEAGFQLRIRIIWHFEHGLHALRRLSGRYETILWFTKTDDYTFNLDPIRVPSKYPGKWAFKGDKKGQPTGNPAGQEFTLAATFCRSP